MVSCLDEHLDLALPTAHVGAVTQHLLAAAAAGLDGRDGLWQVQFVENVKGSTMKSTSN